MRPACSRRCCPNFESAGRPVRPLTGRWERQPVLPRRQTKLGLSFRPLQAESLGLDPDETLRTLVEYPFEVIRLAAYWDRLVLATGKYRTDELDRQLDIAEGAGKRIILSLGPVKNFGYPEFFVPPHHLLTPLPEGELVAPTHPLLRTSIDYLVHLVERYKNRPAIMAWQVEHEATDPLGMEHSWRLSAGFVQQEVAAVRAADPTRPVLMNGFLPTSTLVNAQQWWRTRDQGDSLDAAMRFADIVGIDFYPRHALVNVRGRTLYLEGANRPWQQSRRLGSCWSGRLRTAGS